MLRLEILNQVEQIMGFVPGFIYEMDDDKLEEFWGTTSWYMSDTGLSAREKALVGFGAASALHCPY